MYTHTIFFLCALSFLSGVIYASLGLSLLATFIPSTLVFSFVYLSNVRLATALCAALCVIIGAVYYYQDDYRYNAAMARIPATGTFRGIISQEPTEAADYQSFFLASDSGAIVVETAPVPRFAYGDSIIVEGRASPPTPAYYSRRVLAILRNPKITLISSGKGNPIIAALFTLKENVLVSYQRVLSRDQGALLFGIVFGESNQLSQQLATNLQMSGLRFITAIDGLHIQIMILIALGIFSYLLPRRYALTLTFFFVILFIALTGFTTSGIRASLMAALSGFARENGRQYVPHIALTLSALLLTLINPKILLFDVGFQLSFLAVISIVYLLPVMRVLLRLNATPGLLSWRDSLLITISVQLTTAPIIMMQFQTFSFSSLVASVLIVWMLPFILIVGFLLALVSFIAFPLTKIIGLIASPLMNYVLLVVNGFARLTIPFNPQWGFTSVAIYYSLIVFFVYWYYGTSTEIAQKPPEPQPLQKIGAEAAGFEIIEIV